MDAYARLLRLPAVIRRTGLSRSSIHQYVAAGVMPAPVRVAARVVVWLRRKLSTFCVSESPHQEPAL